MVNVAETCQEIARQFQAAGQQPESGSYAKLATVLTALETELREYIQKTTGNDVNMLISKLKTSQALTSAEQELLRQWVVGDAESYVKSEQNVPQWLNELQRIVGELNRLCADALSVGTAFALRGLLRDAIRVVWDVHHYYEHNERLKAFQDSTATLERGERDTLIEILQHKINSKQW